MTCMHEWRAKDGSCTDCGAEMEPHECPDCNYLYFRVRCNDTQCPAIAAVHLDTALVAVGLNDER